MPEACNDNAGSPATQGSCDCKGDSHVVVVIDGNKTTAAAPTNQPSRRDPEVFPLISKVHGRVRNIDPGAYDPMVVSLGPYHAGRDDLLQMQREKPMCMGELCSLTGRTELYYLQQVISPRLRKQALMYYSHGIHDLRQAAGRNERDIMVNFRFNRMLLHDAAFLLITMKALDNEDAAHGERRTHGRWMDAAIVHDLLLLENQIPFAVVEELYYQVAAVGQDDEHCKPFSDVMQGFVRRIIKEYANKECSPHQNGRVVHHLLHQCHMLLEPTKSPVTGDTSGRDEDDDEHQQDDASVKLKRRWHRAVQYHVAGVGLTKRIFDGGVKHHRLLDVEYRGGALEIPVLNVYDYTCSMLRNLMAMEQTTAGVGNYITAYCIFLSRLMCTAEDVALLTKKGILVHHLGSDEIVAGLFADLCKNVVFDDDDVGCNYLRAACVAADERYQSRVRNWMTWLKHKHFSNPWLAMGAVAAVVVTICAVVQAVFAVLPKK